MVQPTGTATATTFLEMPLERNPYPVSWCNFCTVSSKLRLVLNISFRITSNGLVNAAPKTPAVADLRAERQSKSDRQDNEDGSGLGKCCSIQSLTTIAVQYFGTKREGTNVISFVKALRSPPRSTSNQFSAHQPQPRTRFENAGTCPMPQPTQSVVLVNVANRCGRIW